MKKEILTKENIIKDLLRVEKIRRNIRHEVRFYVYAPCIAIAILIFLLWRNWLFSIPFAVVAIYHIIRLIIELRELNARRAAIINGDFAVSSDTLTHIAEELALEPNIRMYNFALGYLRRSSVSKDITVLYFRGGSWRLYEKNEFPNRGRHYHWSKEFAMSTEGLLNTSVEGNEFYVVTFEGEIVYAYNDKFFEYKE